MLRRRRGALGGGGAPAEQMHRRVGAHRRRHAAVREPRQVCARSVMHGVEGCACTTGLRKNGKMVAACISQAPAVSEALQP